MACTFRSSLYVSLLFAMILGLNACGGKTASSSSASTVSSGLSSSSRSSQSLSSASSKRYSELSRGKSLPQNNVEQVLIAEEATGFNKSTSLDAFRRQVYPILRDKGCGKCHSSMVNAALGGQQAPLLADDDSVLAHEYALTAVYFKNPKVSKLIEHVGIYRHFCGGITCASLASQLLQAVQRWADEVSVMLPVTPSGVTTTATLNDSTIEDWIAKDKASFAAADLKYQVYTSLHEWYLAGASAEDLNIIRVAISKALNSTARFAPTLINPVDINGQGLVYRFDIRNYWGYNQGVTALLFGGSDDDLAFGNGKKDYQGNAVSASVQNTKYNFRGVTVKDAEHAWRIWERILHGNVEGAVTSGNLIANINGFKGAQKQNAAGVYVDINQFKWVEATQLVYTLSRPDVYNAIMTNPMYADEMESNLGVIQDKGLDSFDYLVAQDGVTVDSRFMYRANTPQNGLFWKTFDVFTGDTENANFDLREVYSSAEGNAKIRFPFWANPVPKFVDWFTLRDPPKTLSFVATLAQAMAGTKDVSSFIASTTPGCDPMNSYAGSTFKYCRHFTGTGGFQQSESDIIYSLPNGLHGYYHAGGQNQRRLDMSAMTQRDPRKIPDADDNITYMSAYAFTRKGAGGTVNVARGSIGSSCMACHRDGINRVNNDLREWLDNKSERLPVGTYGVDNWIQNSATLARVKELYKPNNYWRDKIEQDRSLYLSAMHNIKHNLILGKDKNIYVEPIVYVTEMAMAKYGYVYTTSN